MGSGQVVVLSPSFQLLSRIFEGENQMYVQAFVAQPAVEALDVAVLPGTAGLDVQRPGAQLRQPVPQLLGHELRAVVRAKVLRDSPLK